MEIKSNKQGVCPLCNSQNLDYGTINLEGELCNFKWKCLNCGGEGEEWYEMTFAGHNVKDENGDLWEI